MNKLNIRDLGIIEYNEALKIQENIFNQSIALKQAGQPVESTLLLCEHPSVYTMGKHADANHFLKASEQIPRVQTNRGGDITYHGPGQIVLYPILDLESVHWGLAQYVETLEKIGIALCAAYGIQAHALKGFNGVWIENQRKIMAIGIKASRHITMHGVAFNVNTELSPYNDIVPCGISDKAVTSLRQELHRDMDMESVKKKMVEIFTSFWHE